MKLSIEFDPSKIFLLKKCVNQLRKTCPSQQIFVIFDNNYIIFATESGPQNLSFIVSYFIMGNDFILTKQNIESKKANNTIIVKIKDFTNFAQYIASFSEKLSSLTFLLTKDQSFRFLKMKLGESNKRISTMRSEIDLVMEDFKLIPREKKVFSLNIPTRDLIKLLDICSKEQTQLKIHIQVSSKTSSETNKILASITMSTRSPINLKVAYKKIPLDFIMDNINLEVDMIYNIPIQYSKQLSSICSIDEAVYIGILEGKELFFEFCETDETGSIFAMKFFVVPKLVDFEEEEEEGDGHANRAFSQDLDGYPVKTERIELE